MFQGLGDRLSSVFDKLRKRGALSESDVSAAMREVRVALLEADVALPVVKKFIDTVRERAVGREVLRSVTPGQMVVKITQDSTVARTVSWAGGTFRWAGGTAHPMNTTLNGFSIYTFETWDGGTTWWGAGADYS